MEVTLDDEQVAELRSVLDEVLGELSTEIAGTDNHAYRVTLRQRRENLQQIKAQLDGG